MYLRSTLSNDIFKKLLALVPLTVTIPEVCVSTMTAVLYNFYYALEDILNHLKSLKLKYMLRIMLQISVLKSCYMMSILRGLGTLSPSILRYITWIFRILLVLYFSFGQFIITSRLYSSPKNFCLRLGCHTTRGTHCLQVTYAIGYA